MNGLDMVSYWMIGICFLDATRFRENCFCIGLISFPFYAFLRAWQRLFKATLRGVDRVHFSEPLRVLVCELGSCCCFLLEYSTGMTFHRLVSSVSGSAGSGHLLHLLVELDHALLFIGTHFGRIWKNLTPSAGFTAAR